MKKCPTLYVIRKLEIKRTVSEHTFIRMAKLQNTKTSNADKDMEQ